MKVKDWIRLYKETKQHNKYLWKRKKEEKQLKKEEELAKWLKEHRAYLCSLRIKKWKRRLLVWQIQEAISSGTKSIKVIL